MSAMMFWPNNNKSFYMPNHFVRDPKRYRTCCRAASLKHSTAARPDELEVGTEADEARAALPAVSQVYSELCRCAAKHLVISEAGQDPVLQISMPASREIPSGPARFIDKEFNAVYFSELRV